MAQEKQASVVNIRTTPSIAGRLDALVARYPVLKKHAIARIALELGMERMENDPHWLEKMGNAKNHRSTTVTDTTVTDRAQSALHCGSCNYRWREDKNPLDLSKPVPARKTRK